ncbi:MAG: cytochrome oxidase assembly protein [Chloroflexota bacterium]|nr:MAG: cytochrome oxidase assembly protein [Chloroflexota bacterium]
MEKPLSQIKPPADKGELNFRILTILGLIVSFIQISLGGFVRVTDSGMACGDDWPLCDGQLVPAFNFEVVLEYAHRVSGAVLIVLILIIFIYAWRLHRNNPWIFRSAAAALIFVFAGAGFGAATVFSELGWGFRLIHLVIAEAVIGSLAFAFVGSLNFTQYGINGPAKGSMASGTVYMVGMMLSLFLLILSGSIMVGLDAGTACGTWPLCNGSLFPQGDSRYAIHMGHRLIGIVAGVVMLLAFAWIWRMREWITGAGKVAIVLFVLMIAQVLLGAVLIWTGFAPGWRAIHLAGGSLVWLVACILFAVIFVTREAPSNSEIDVKESTSIYGEFSS